MAMQIYWIKAQAPRRVLALVKHLGLETDFVEMDLMGGAMNTPAYAALNPNKKAPTLVDGDLVLWEASAIMAHLCVKANSDMWPAHDPSEQVEVLRWLSWGDHHWNPLLGPFYFEHVVKPTFKIGPSDRTALEGKADALQRSASVLDGHLAGRNYIACDRLTIADFQLASMATYWRECEMPLEGFQNVVAWIDRLMGIPAWADPWPAGGRAAA
jgi:glutathione S-transferase